MHPIGVASLATHFHRVPFRPRPARGAHARSFYKCAVKIFTRRSVAVRTASRFPAVAPPLHFIPTARLASRSTTTTTNMEAIMNRHEQDQQQGYGGETGRFEQRFRGGAAREDERRDERPWRGREEHVYGATRGGREAAHDRDEPGGWSRAFDDPRSRSAATVR